MEDQQKIVEDFMSFTGTEDAARATTFLQAADWNLPDAVQLFFAEQTTMEPGFVNEFFVPTGVLCRPSKVEEEEEEDAGMVRAPIPSKVERIIDQPSVYEQRVRERETQTPIYEAFRNHSAELAEYEHGPDAKGGTTVISNVQISPIPARAQGLAKLYKAPIDLLFRGSFEGAKESAMKKNIWLMVNIQSAEEFASHQLNCDTFSNEALKEMIKANFIFFQTYTSGVTGERLTVMYQIQQCPCILIIDPITGGLMQSVYGFIEAERLIEYLIRYLDFTPEDESGTKKIQSLQNRRGKAKEQIKDASSPVLTKEIQDALAVALEASKKRKSDADDQQDAGDEGSSQMVEESSTMHRKLRSKTNVIGRDELTEKESERRQPIASAVPESTGEDTCLVCILLPDGRRVKRVFYKSDKVESLYGFCNAEFPEALEKPYKLIPRIPGSKPIEDWEMSVDSAGVAGSILALIWD